MSWRVYFSLWKKMRNYLYADYSEKYVLVKLKILQRKESSVSNLLP